MSMDMNKMMRQVQQMQKQLAKEQEKLGQEMVEGSAGGSAVVVQMTGLKELKSITISKEAVDPEDVETLQDLIMLAFNEAMEKAAALAEQRMGGVTGGMGLPGMGF